MTELARADLPKARRSGTGPLDVIGDVHGQADKLERLLGTLGYEETGGVWTHRERRAAFIGDLIDRGPGQLKTIAIARAMVDAGTALIVMGNHEYNAICWATSHPDESGGHLRTRSGDNGPKHRHQHEAFLREVTSDSRQHVAIIEWFKTFPLWLDLGDVRLVHACWDPDSMARISPELGPNNTLTDTALVRSAMRRTPEYRAIETLLKGPEVELPTGTGYLDKDGIERTSARYAWWRSDARTYARGALIPNGAKTMDEKDYPQLPDAVIPTAPSEPYRDAVPLFVGHYWRTGTRSILSEHVACVDYSAGKGGPLVAYRWDGEQLLSDDKFVAVD